MGCTPRKQFSENLKRSNIKNPNFRSSTMSRRSTILPVEQELNLLRTGAKTCLKIDIQSENPKFVYYSLDLSSTHLSMEAEYYSEIFNEVRHCYSIFSSDLENFYFLAHKVCLNKPDFSALLKVLMLSLVLNKNIQIEVSDSLPWVRVNGFLHEHSKKLLEAWKKLGKTIQVLSLLQPTLTSHISKLQKFKNTVDYYSELGSDPYQLRKTSKNLYSAVETAKWVLQKSSSIESESLEFFSSFSLESLELEELDFSEEVNISGKEIVHQLINSNKY